MTELRVLTLSIRLIALWFVLKPLQVLVLTMPIRPVPGAPLRIPDQSDFLAFLATAGPSIVVAALVLWKANRIARLMGGAEHRPVFEGESATTEWCTLIVRIAGLALLAIGIPQGITALVAVGITLTTGTQNGLADFVSTGPFASSITAVLMVVSGLILILRSRTMTQWLVSAEAEKD